MNVREDAVTVNHLDFSYPGGGPALFQELDLLVPSGSRCLLLGRNGVGKSTLLRLIGGKHMVPQAAVQVWGRPAFHDTGLVARVALLAGPFPFDVDLSVSEILSGRSRSDDRSHEGREPDPVLSRRLDRLLALLQIDPGWRMHRLSDGQRRRVQILLGLMQQVDLVLLDEVTADLDVVARADLLGFLREESTGRGVTVIYATHVLDGLERWATHLCFLRPVPGGGGRSQVRIMAPLDEVAELRRLREAGEPSPLLVLCDRWLRE